MSRYRKVSTRIWNDERFNALSDSGKLVFFFLLTHPHMTPIGGMRATLAGLGAELGWSAEAFREAFREASAQGMAKHDPKACFVMLPNFLKHNGPESPNVVKSWVGCLDDLPECTLKMECISNAIKHLEGMSEGFMKAFPEAFREALAKGMPKAMPNQKQKQEQRTEKEMSAGADDRPAAEPRQGQLAARSRFPDFWTEYPRRENKRAAMQAWVAKRLDRIADQIIADVVNRKARHRPWLDGFVPHAATYLRGERWADEIATASARTANTRPEPQQLREL